MSGWMRALTWVMMLLFVFAVVVQYNDPDPVQWMLIYGAAAVACGLALLGRMPRWVPLLMGAAALVWSALLLPGVVGVVSPGELVEEFEMKSEPVEKAREGIGLLIIAAWMLVLFLKGRARRAVRA